jgi:Tfp pilus assembly protein PilN
VAIGLAMRLLKENDSSLRVNLLPPESTEVKAAKKHLLITTNIVAAVILLTILTAGALAMMANKVNQRVTQKKKNELSQDTYILLQEQEKLEEQIRHLSDRPERLQSILDSRHSVNWARILEDIGKMTPKMVRITNLYSNDNTTMYLDGLALSYEMVHLFVKMLDQSEYINSASLNETVREDKTGGLVKYVIVCSLTQDKEE